MSRDYQSPDYSLEDLRLAIEAMCKSLEGSGLIDEHEHPSAYSALLDTAKWMAELEGQEPVAWMGFGPRDGRPEFSINKPAGCVMRDFSMRPVFSEPVNARLLEALKRAKGKLVAFKFIPGEANRWEESDEEALAAIDSAIAAAEAQQERLLQDMHDAGREIDRVMAEPQPDADGWINPNDKTRKQYLPHIGERVLFCHAGITYYGKHTGGSFQSFNPPRTFGTWDCLWMYPPKAREAQP